MASAALLIDNLADGGTLTASSQVVNMEVAHLQAPNVRDDPWRSTSGTANVTLDLIAELSIDTVALLGLNATSGALLRVRISTGAGGSTAGDLHDVAYDSGDAQFDANYGALVVALPTPVTGRFVRFDITNTLSYVEAGRLIVGKRESFDYNFAPGSALEWIDPSAVVKAKGGQSLVWNRLKMRAVTIDLPWVSNAQRWGMIETIGRVHGKTKDVLIVLDPLATNLPQWTIWGLITDAGSTNWLNLPDLYSKNLKIEERL